MGAGVGSAGHAKRNGRKHMPRANKDELPVEQIDAYEGRVAQMDGYTVAFEKMPVDFPPHELFGGLPDDRCQCEHWGYVFKGAIKFEWADGTEEVYRAGDAYFAPPGHLPTVLEDFEGVEFSPKEKLAQTLGQIEKNLQAADQGG
jgi:hypothetical protein